MFHTDNNLEEDELALSEFPIALLAALSICSSVFFNSCSDFIPCNFSSLFFLLNISTLAANNGITQRIKHSIIKPLCFSLLSWFDRLFGQNKQNKMRHFLENSPACYLPSTYCNICNDIWPGLPNIPSC